MRQMSVRALLPTVALLTALGLAGCGNKPTAAADDPSAAPPATAVNCHGGPDGWPVGAMAGGIDSRHPREDLATALSALVASTGIDAPFALADLGPEDMADGPWFVLAETDTEATLASGPWTTDGPGEDGQYVNLTLKGGRWKADGWGNCPLLSPVPPAGKSWVEVAAADGLDRESATLEVLVTERQCASGRDPQPHLLEPTVVETAEDVTVTWTSAVVSGVADCQGNPAAPMTLDLDEPLGDRALLDASRWPARVVVPALS